MVCTQYTKRFEIRVYQGTYALTETVRAFGIGILLSRDLRPSQCLVTRRVSYWPAETREVAGVSLRALRVFCVSQYTSMYVCMC